MARKLRSLAFDEAVLFFNQLESEAKASAAWRAMTDGDDADRWTDVEEHLLEKDQDQDPKRWKYFAK